MEVTSGAFSKSCLVIVAFSNTCLRIWEQLILIIKQ